MKASHHTLLCGSVAASSASPAMSALVQLHGAEAVRHVFVADRQKLRQAMAGEAAALPQSSVWCEAYIETGTPRLS